MQAFRPLILVFVACLAGCGQGQLDAPQVSPGATSTKASGSPACPSSEFEGFLAAFAASSEVQKSFTAVPLQSDSLEADAEPEPRRVMQRLTPPALVFPVMQTDQQQREEGLAMSRRRSGRDMIVTLAKPDTDYQVTYYFHQKNGCWELYRKFDESI